jgi:hypothetical protein
MKILKLLNKNNFSIIFILLLTFNSYAEDEPVDIWNIDKNENQKISQTEISILENDIDDNTVKESSIYKLRSQKQIDTIELDENLDADTIKIVGLYDPSENGLDLNMWSKSDGNQLKNIFSNLNKIDLSEDAAEILNISILTNSYYPKKNITESEFLKIKADWLIKNSNLDLIEEYLIKNQIIDTNSSLTRYLVDQYLSQSNIEKACEIFSKNQEPISNDYLSKFNIYCLINAGKNEEAQLILDLKKELGFEDSYYEKKINYLVGLSAKANKNISEKSILDFHLAHRTNPEFSFEPKNSTSKLIWKYLSSSNLLYDHQEIEITKLDKISTIENATHNKNYPEKDLFEIYKRFQFTIDQLINAKESYKLLSKIEARALIYQKILLESEITKKLEFMRILKDLFEKENIGGAFEVELKKFLEKIDTSEIPSNLTSFYNRHIKKNNELNKKIKFNNDVMHQSKLVNYFNGDYAKSKIEKDVNNFLKKIKKDKKYFFSKKDVIFLESLKADGIKISKKYDNLYTIDQDEMPSDIQLMINNNEIGAALLRIVEVIGQDKVEEIDAETMYFVISTLNQLNIDLIRNKILLKVLPLKV